MAKLKVPVGPADHVAGTEQAPVTLVEYGDYECPHCAHAHPIVQAVQEHFGKQLRFVFRNFPLTQIHPHAEMAAEAAEFAGAKGRFWEMHDGIFENQRRLGSELLAELAEAMGLSSDEMAAALENHEYLPRVKDDFMGGVRSGVNGTPTFFINGEVLRARWKILPRRLRRASRGAGRSVGARARLPVFALSESCLVPAGLNPCAFEHSPQTSLSGCAALFPGDVAFAIDDNVNRIHLRVIHRGEVSVLGKDDRNRARMVGEIFFHSLIRLKDVHRKHEQTFFLKFRGNVVD